jgi:hypothetical protein
LWFALDWIFAAAAFASGATTKAQSGVPEMSSCKGPLSILRLNIAANILFFFSVFCFHISSIGQ